MALLFFLTVFTPTISLLDSETKVTLIQQSVKLHGLENDSAGKKELLQCKKMFKRIQVRRINDNDKVLLKRRK
jgi:hypothetical protein